MRAVFGASLLSIKTLFQRVIVLALQLFPTKPAAETSVFVIHFPSTFNDKLFVFQLFCIISSTFSTSSQQQTLSCKSNECSQRSPFTVGTPAIYILLCTTAEAPGTETRKSISDAHSCFTQCFRLRNLRFSVAGQLDTGTHNTQSFGIKAASLRVELLAGHLLAGYLWCFILTHLFSSGLEFSPQLWRSIVEACQCEVLPLKKKLLNPGLRTIQRAFHDRF